MDTPFICMTALSTSCSDGSGASRTVFPVHSSVSVSDPNSITASYVLLNPVIREARRVSAPVHTTRRPDAKLSSVPVCPTFEVSSACFMVKREEKLVTPGHFAKSTMPPAPPLLFFMNFFIRLFKGIEFLHHFESFLHAGIDTEGKLRELSYAEFFRNRRLYETGGAVKSVYAFLNLGIGKKTRHVYFAVAEVIGDLHAVDRNER